jgi:hypothetical protein
VLSGDPRCAWGLHGAIVAPSGGTRCGFRAFAA